MYEQFSSPRLRYLVPLRVGLYVVSAVLLLVLYLLPLRSGEAEFAWWTPVLIGVPFLLAVLLTPNRHQDASERLRRRRWRDPRLHSAQER